MIKSFNKLRRELLQPDQYTKSPKLTLYIMMKDWTLSQKPGTNQTGMSVLTFNTALNVLVKCYYAGKRRRRPPNWKESRKTISKWSYIETILRNSLKTTHLKPNKLGKVVSYKINIKKTNNFIYNSIKKTTFMNKLNKVQNVSLKRLLK